MDTVHLQSMQFSKLPNDIACFRMDYWEGLALIVGDEHISAPRSEYFLITNSIHEHSAYVIS